MNKFQEQYKKETNKEPFDNVDRFIFSKDDYVEWLEKRLELAERMLEEIKEDL